jgi:hypothetical protein
MLHPVLVTAFKRYSMSFCVYSKTHNVRYGPLRLL